MTPYEASTLDVLHGAWVMGGIAIFLGLLLGGFFIALIVSCVWDTHTRNDRDDYE